MQRGFTVVELDDDAARVAAAADEAMRSLFARPAHEKRALHATCSEVGGARALLGYHVPSPAKELFRYRRGHPLQPLPSTGAELLVALYDACAAVVESTLSATRRELLRLGFSAPLEYPDAGTASASSPLDFFLYNNDAANVDVPNCAEHIDRGWASCVVCSSTPGLEVLDLASGAWVQVGLRAVCASWFVVLHVVWTAGRGLSAPAPRRGRVQLL
jgi:hypothetical protein